MIKVIDKTFGVLEAIVAASPQPVAPTKLAKTLGLTVSTVSHILKMLLDSGYILQVSRQAGYVAGPKLPVLSNMANFEGALLSAARPLVDRVAQSIQETVLISRIYGDLRYVLYLKNGNPARAIRPTRAGSDDLYRTATGLLELAYRPWKEQLALYRKYHTAEVLPGAETTEQLQQLFADICHDGFFTARKRDMGIFAVPVFADGKFVAALGCNLPASRFTPAHNKKVIKILQGAAEELSAALGTHEI